MRQLAAKDNSQRDKKPQLQTFHFSNDYQWTRISNLENSILKDFKLTVVPKLPVSTPVGLSQYDTNKCG